MINLINYMGHKADSDDVAATEEKQLKCTVVKKEKKKGGWRKARKCVAILCSNPAVFACLRVDLLI